MSPVVQPPGTQIMKPYYALILFLSSLPNGWATELPRLEAVYDSARVRAADGQLEITTGAVTRHWQWTGHGLLTREVTDESNGHSWSRESLPLPADWTPPGGDTAPADAVWMDVTARESDDEGFTSGHLEVTALIRYPSTGQTLRYVIWAYPGAPGLRTQLHVKSGRADLPADSIPGGPVLRIVRGSGFVAPDFKNQADPWFGSVAVHSQAVEIMAEGLTAGASGKLGLSWWDWGGGGRVQSVELSSIDGEARATVVEATPLPAFKRKGEMPVSKVVDVPDGLSPDGTLRIQVTNREGPNANLSEVWLYQAIADGIPASPPPGPAARIRELQDLAPDGYRLTAYLNAGPAAVRSATSKLKQERRADHLPIPPGTGPRHYIGYYNDTQHRNAAGQDILRTEKRTEPPDDTERVDWASIVFVEHQEAGLGLVKESHKCVNQSGVDTGAFLLDTQGLSSTGWGPSDEDLTGDRFHWCWANWMLVSGKGELERQWAVKQFDRLRFPLRLERDMHIKSNTWGHSRNPRDGRNYATEAEVLPEMASAADLGVDLFMIDDGWQVSLKAKGAHPDGGIGWKPHPSTYADGWTRVAARARELNLSMGLWGVAQSISLEDLLWNHEQGDFIWFKLDFARLGNYPALHEMMSRARAFGLGTEHRAQVTWDVTENAPRYGYFWARDYGNMHFMNRKPYTPENVVYVPWLALRDFWELAHYANLNQWQLTVPNIDSVDRRYSDAHLYNHPYCYAMSLMGIPMIFQITRFNTEEAREQIRPLLALYKQHRKALFTSYVFPLGDPPSNGSWCGFQTWHPERKRGYLTIFRERLSKVPQHRLSLPFLTGRSLELKNLRTGAVRRVRADHPEGVLFTVEQPADFLFLQYTVLED